MYLHPKSLLFMCLILFCIGSTLSEGAEHERFVVVIDAGHGGKDPGAVGGNMMEKDINLSVALKLGTMISDSCPGIRVVYTRMTDVFVGLNERSDLCNRVHADLFISIHTNASRNYSAKGMETYVMGMEKTSENLSLAMRENSVIEQEDDYTETYEGYDPSSSESFIIFSLQQHAFQNESLKFASVLQDMYNADFASRTLDKGVKQANFIVLWKTASPSVLTEIGFISNAEDRKFITSSSGQKAIASSLYKSVKSYYEDYRKPGVEVRPEPVKPLSVENVGAKKYRVQILADRKAVTVTQRNFHQWVDEVRVIYKDGYFKYFVGGTDVYEEILSLQNSLRKYFPDCFIVTSDGEQYGGDE